MNKKVGVKIISSVLLGTMCFYTMPVFANTKEEVVYSKLKNDGTNYSTVVSERITNTDNSELINDISELLNIENTNGDETFEQNGTNVVWKANGKDIQYQGTIDKDEPITCKVKYELNGKEVEAKDIVGKSGNVKVTLTYTNNDAHTVKVNGKYEKMYTPFIVVAGTIIDNNFKNVNITNGKIIDNGNKKMAIAMCFPGLQESLGISKDKIDIPNTIELTMDAEDFEMNNIISYATPKLVSEADLDMFDNLDDIYAQANKLQDASNQLVDGANQVNEGATQLKTGMSSALSGANTIKTAVQTSRDSLANDKSSALKKSQVTAIGESASKTALAGVKSKKAKIIAMADAGIEDQKSTIEEGAIKSAKQIAETTAISAVENSAVQVAYSAAVETAEETAWTTAQTTAGTVYDAIVTDSMIEQQVIAGMKAKVSAMASMTDEQIKATPAYKNAYKEAKDNNESTKAAATAKLNENTIKATAKQKVDQDFDAKNDVASATSKKGKEVLATALSDEQKAEIKAKADAGIEDKKSTIKSTIEEGAVKSAKQIIEEEAVKNAKQIAETTAYTTAQSTAESVGKQVGETVASQVADTVKGAALKQVASSMGTLADGLEELTDGLDQLNSGAESLSNGTETLANGMKQFNEDGIKKVVNYINGDVKDMKERADALKDLANKYKSFAGINEKDEGTVSFITTIDSIKKEDFEKENAQATNGNTTNETVANETISNQDSKNETSNN